MTAAKMSPLRRRMVEDMQIRGLEATTQTSYLRAIEVFAGFLGRSPDSATPAELRAWQPHMARTHVSIPIYNHRITVLRFFFSVTCGRDESVRPLRLRRAPRKLPEVLSPDEAARLLDAAPGPGPGLKYRAVFSVAYGAGLRASEVVRDRVGCFDAELAAALHFALPVKRLQHSNPSHSTQRFLFSLPQLSSAMQHFARWE